MMNIIKKLLKKNMDEMLEVEHDKDKDSIPEEISIYGTGENSGEYIHAIKCNNIEIFMYKVKDND